MQLSIILHCIYKELTGEDFFENNTIDFNNSTIRTRIRICTQKFRNNFTTWIKQDTEKAKKRIEIANDIIAEADSLSAQYRKESAEADSTIAADKKRIKIADSTIARTNKETVEKLINTLNAIIDFYNYYKTSPDEERLKSFKPKVQNIRPRFKKYNINTDKLPDEAKKLFGVE